jgi:hypothetical protein
MRSRQSKISSQVHERPLGFIADTTIQLHSLELKGITLILLRIILL